MKSHEWSISLGKVGLAALFDPTGTGPILTFLQEVYDQVVSALPDQQQAAVARFLKDVEQNIETQVAIGRLTASDMDVLIANTGDLLHRYTFGAYDLGRTGNNPHNAAALVLERGERLLHTLERKHQNQIRVILVAYFEALARQPRVFEAAGREFRNRLGVDLADLEQQIEAAQAAQAEHAADVMQLRQMLRTVNAASVLDDGRLSTSVLTPTVLVKADYAIVPFVGRDGEIQGLLDWCGRPEPGPLLCIVHGAGGMGKTRLLLETFERLRAEDAPWRAGFLQRDSAARLPEAVPHLLAHGDNLLVVIDYAETRKDDVIALLRACNQAQGNQNVRIVLLSRQLGEWTNDLQRQSEIGRLRDQRAIETVELRALFDDPAERDELATAARDLYRNLLPTESETTDLPDLGEPHFGAVLYILMAAFLASRGEAVTDREELLDRFLDRESAYWAGHERFTGKPPTYDELEIAAAIFTLYGLTPMARARDTLDAVPDLRDAEHRSRIPAVFHDFYPADRTIEGIPQVLIGSVTPDILGEHLLIRVCNKAPSLVQDTLAADINETQCANAMTVLARAARTAPALKSTIRATLKADLRRLVRPAMAAAVGPNPDIGELLSDTFLDASNVTLAKELEPILPQQTVALRSFSLVVTEALYQNAKETSKPNDDDDRREWARIANNFANRLSDVGRRKEAANVAQEAVDLRRELAANDPDAFTPDLAASLNNLASWLSEVGLRDEAVPVAQEAVDLRRQLASRHPDVFTPDLAASLSNLSNRLGDVGLRDEAASVAQEAVNLRRELASRHPDAFTPDLAMSLSNLANRLSEIGLRDEAVLAATEALDLRRELASRYPDAFTPDLAMSLNTLSNRLSEVGRRNEAVPLAEEAADLYRDLAARLPDAFLPGLAMSLNNLAIRLSGIGRRDDAVPVAQEAADLYRDLTTQHPDVFTPDLAMSLSNLANWLSDVGRRDDAVQMAQDAANLHRDLAAHHPDAFTPNFAGSLSNLSIHQSKVGHRDEAAHAAQEAVNLCRGLVARHYDAFTPNLATALSNLAPRLSDIGHHNQAVLVAQEAVNLRRELAARHPDAFTPDLATSLHSLATLLSDVGRRDEAVLAVSEAVDLRRKLAAHYPDAFTPELAASLHNLAAQLSEVGHRDEAVSVAQEVVDLQRELAARHPDVFLPALAKSLHNMAIQLSDIGRSDEAVLAAEEAVELRRDLAARHPDAFAPDFAASLNNLAQRLSDVGRHDEAAQVAQEAERLIRRLG